MTQFSIAIDGYNLAIRNGTGIATYGFALARTLRNAGCSVTGVFGVDTGSDPALRDVIFFDRLARKEPENRPRAQIRREARRLLREAVHPRLVLQAEDIPLTGRVETASFADRLPAFDRLVSAPRLFDVAHRHFGLYKRFMRLRIANPPAIMHWTYPVPIELEGARNIYTLHDLVPIRLPYTTLDSKQFYAGIIAQCVRRAAHICTVSEASRADILAEYNLDPDSVTNTYQIAPMPDAALANSAEMDAAMIEGIFGLPSKGYFLYFGAIEPKKNLGRLIEAYLSIQTETPLVIVGGRSWEADDELRLLSVEGNAGARRVVRLDYLPRLLLLRLIRSARAVLFPSLYEGFGLPILEALQMGTPVITSTTSSLPEIAGEAALLVDPYDVVAIADALRRMDGDQALRRRLAEAAPRQAARFSEAAYRERLEAMYTAVMTERPR